MLLKVLVIYRRQHIYLWTACTRSALTCIQAQWLPSDNAFFFCSGISEIPSRQRIHSYVKMHYLLLFLRKDTFMI